MCVVLTCIMTTYGFSTQIYRVWQKKHPHTTDVILWPPSNFLHSKLHRSFLISKWWVPAFCLPRSVHHIAEKEIRLTAFCHVSAQVNNDVMKQKRLERGHALLHWLEIRGTKCVFIIDEKNFYLNLLVSNQNSTVWTTHLVSWSGVKSLCSMRWSQLQRVLVARVHCILFIRKQMSIMLIMLIIFFLTSKTALDCCPPDSYSSKRMHKCTQLIYTRLDPGKQSGLHCQRSVASKFARLKPLDYHVWGQCWRLITSIIQNQK